MGGIEVKFEGRMYFILNIGSHVSITYHKYLHISAQQDV